MLKPKSKQLRFATRIFIVAAFIFAFQQGFFTLFIPRAQAVCVVSPSTTAISGFYVNNAAAGASSTGYGFNYTVQCSNNKDSFEGAQWSIVVTASGFSRTISGNLNPCGTSYCNYSQNGSMSLSGFPTNTSFNALLTVTNGGGYSTQTSVSFSIGSPPCNVSSFICDSAYNLVWATASCTSASIAPAVGAWGPLPAANVAAGSLSGAKAGTVYTFSASNGSSSASANYACPSSPKVGNLQVTWPDGSTSMTITNVTPGQSKSATFNFSNVGVPGSIIHYQRCDAISGDINVNQPDCPPPHDLTVP